MLFVQLTKVAVHSRVQWYSGLVPEPKHHVKGVLARWGDVAWQLRRLSFHHADIHQRHCNQTERSLTFLSILRLFRQGSKRDRLVLANRYEGPPPRPIPRGTRYSTKRDSIRFGPPLPTETTIEGVIRGREREI